MLYLGIQDSYLLVLCLTVAPALLAGMGSISSTPPPQGMSLSLPVQPWLHFFFLFSHLGCYGSCSPQQGTP